MVMPEEMHTTIATIEKEAEKVLKEARASARQILVAAEEEANRILSSELALGEIQIERDKVIHAAEEEASKQLEESKKRASELRASAKKKADVAVRLIKSYIRGIS
jgi:vacuolar-type H+-ATPase subunit H